MEKQSISIKKLVGTDIRSRSNGKIIEDCINDIKEKHTRIILDFESVSYISRSFADELCEISNSFSDLQIEMTGMEESVKTMFDIVRLGREKGRVRKDKDANILTFNDMESLSAFLQNA